MATVGRGEFIKAQLSTRGSRSSLQLANEEIPYMHTWEKQGKNHPPYLLQKVELVWRGARRRRRRWRRRRIHRSTRHDCSSVAVYLKKVEWLSSSSFFYLLFAFSVSKVLLTPPSFAALLFQRKVRCAIPSKIYCAGAKKGADDNDI